MCETSKIYKEINIHGKINTEIDEFDAINKIIYEYKSVSKLYMDNPDFLQTEQQWASKQIFKKDKNRINVILQPKFKILSVISTNLPLIEDIKSTMNYVFRIDSDTPKLRETLNNELNNLHKLFTNFNFSVIFVIGGD